MRVGIWKSITFVCWVLITLPWLAAQTQPPNEEPPKLEPVRESITVNGAISTDAPADITVLNSTFLDANPGVNIDDSLRNVPGFTLYKRASSVVANPTTQGVSLRGIGSSGASRTLLLWDGIPVNDPFGGWIYWDRFAPEEVDRIEISRGASTSVFGDLAMGGVINVFTEPAVKHRFQAGYEIGDRNTHDLYAGASNLWKHFAISGFARAFTTDGYYIVPATIRGSVDRPASVEFVAGNVRLDVFGAHDHFFTRIDTLVESRQNGTVLQTNSTSLGAVASNYSHDWSRDQISVLGYYTTEQFHATFSSVAANRDSERLTYTQTVPSNGEGGAAYWSHRESRWHFVAGADAQRVEGIDTDKLRPSGLRIGGGTQIEHGVFGQGDVKVGPVQFFAGLRYERGRTDPSAGFVVGHRRIRARGSVYNSFRSPTLNELYRNFQVGNTNTLANANLRPETLFGSELGLDFIGESTHGSVTVFRNAMDDLVTNVTLSVTPTSILRQRENAGKALSRGVEADVQHQWRDFRGQMSYLYVDSQLLTGPWLPQVPRHQGSASLMYQHRGTLASAEVRSFSYQFDDDLNQFRLPGFATVQIAVEQRLTKVLTGQVAVENVLDHQYYTGLTPTPTIGEPRLFRVGIRWQLR